MSKRMVATCHRCGWNGWSNEAHICEFGKSAPAMDDIRRIDGSPKVSTGTIGRGGIVITGDGRHRDILNLLLARAKESAKRCEFPETKGTAYLLDIDDLESIIQELVGE